MNQEAADKWVEVLGKLKEDKAWIKLTQGLGSIPYVRSRKTPGRSSRSSTTHSGP